MSTITTKLPQGQLRWWKMRLETNSEGAVMEVHFPDVDLTAAEKGDFSSATKVVHEIFDGCEGELRGVVSTYIEKSFGRTALYVLAYEQPSDSPRWQPLEAEPLYPPGHHPSYL